MEAIKKIGILDSQYLAEYILERIGQASHLKLQKLLYYVQALHLAYFDAPIIKDEFEAWLHGPVSRKLYNALKDKSILHTEVMFNPNNVDYSPADIITQNLTIEQKELIDEVIDGYGVLTSLQLENLSHKEQPWKQARKGVGMSERCTNIISQESMRTFYKKRLYSNE